MIRLLLLAALLLASFTSLAAADGADAYCSYLDRLLEQGVIGDAELLQVAESAERGSVIDPIRPERARAEYQASVAKRALQALSRRAGSSAEGVYAWASAKLKARGVARQEREVVTIETESLVSRSDSYRRITAGIGFACALSAQDELVCWGRKVPLGIDQLKLLGPLLSLQAKYGQLCVLSKKGDLRCTQGDSHRSVKTHANLGPVRSFAIINSGSHCVLLEAGEVKCFQNYGCDFEVPEGLGEVKYLVGNLNAIYAVREDDTVVHLGKSNLDYPFGVEPVRSLVAEHYNACAILVCGKVACLRPVNGLPAEMIEGTLMLNQYVACLLSPDGLLSCSYELDSFLKIPADMGPLQDAFLRHLGGCALTLDHQVKCWGNLNESGNSLDLPPSSNLEEILRLQLLASGGP